MGRLIFNKKTYINDFPGIYAEFLMLVVMLEQLKIYSVRDFASH